MVQFTKDQDALFLGGLLGDMHIQEEISSLSKSYRLRFSHSRKQLDYINWKYELLKEDFCQNTKGPHLDRTSYVFSTERRTDFEELHNKWYIPNRSGASKSRYVKTVPQDLPDFFTDPKALVVWYLDDGTKRKDTASCRIATQCFSFEEHEILQQSLLQNFGIRSKIEDWGKSDKNEVQYQLAILSNRGRGGFGVGQGDFNKFRDLLYPIVEAEIPSMLYKLQ